MVAPLDQIIGPRKSVVTNRCGGDDVYIRMYYHGPGVKTWWLMRRAAFAAGFRDYVETSQLVKDLPPLSEIIRDAS